MNIDSILKENYDSNIYEYMNNLFTLVREIPYEINNAHSPELLLEK